VFTDKTHSERYTRKWDMQFAPSICSGCAVGCNVSPGERYGEIRRIENRYHGALNGYFLCDRGRFGYGHTNLKERPRQAVLKVEGRAKTIDFDTASAQAQAIVSGAKRMLGIGSPRASLEANHALRDLVGAERYNSGIADGELELIQLAASILRGPVGAATIRSMEDADCVLVLGEDPTQTAPRIALAIRQAARGKMITEGAKKNIAEWQVIALADLVQQSRNPVFVASPEAARIDEIASATLRAAPAQIAQLGFAIAHRLDASSPAPAGIDAATAKLADEMAAALLAATKPLVVSGTGAGSVAVLQSAANVAWALKKQNKAVQIALSVPEANSLGVGLIGAPGVETALKAAAAGEVDVLVVLENDLYRRAEKALVDAALAKVRLVVIDHQMTATAAQACLMLPAASIFESDGTLVNFEGRAQRHFQVYDPAYYDRSVAVQDSWRWLEAMRETVRWTSLDDVTAACAAVMPQFAGIVETAPNAKFRLKGMKLARASHRQSGRTAMRANLSVHEPRATQDADSALAFSMEGANGSMALDRPAELLPFAWAPGWNSPQSWNKFQAEVGGELKGGDPGEPIITTDAHVAPAYFAAAVPAAGEGMRLVVLSHIFGSDELSARAPVIAGRAAQPYVAVSAADAQRLALGSRATVTLGGVSLGLPVQVSPALTTGSVGLPVGLIGLPYAAPGSLVTLAAGA
jgi:NADH-quinone oxidoreductase subunit G